MLRSIVAAAALFLSAQSALSFVYECEITRPSRYGWVGGNIFFGISEKKKEAAVLDGIILKVQEDPVIAKLEVEPGRYTIRWQVKGLSTTSPSSSISTVDFTAIILRKIDKLVLNVKVPGYDNYERGEGVCKKQAN